MLLADKVIYTGQIDAYFNYSLGHLEYRSVRFENELLDIAEFSGKCGSQLYRQGDAVDAYNRTQVV